MSLDLTNFDAALKQYYTSDLIIDQTYQDNPLYAMITKMTKFAGKNLPIVLQYGNPQGRSAQFAQAQKRGLATSSKVGDFLLTRVKDYSFGNIDGETLHATASDMGAFMDAASTEMDGALHTLARSHSVKMYKSGYGEIATIGSFSGSTVTLSSAGDITNFEVGMELVVAASNASAPRALGSSTNGLIVTGVDRGAGTFTCGYAVNDAANGIPTIAAGDMIIVRGDRLATERGCIAGLEAWLPAVAPVSGDAFFGVDRSVDVTRLAGQRMNGVGAPIEEVLIDGAALVGREGGKLSHYMMSFAKYTELEKALGSKVQYIDLKVTAEVGFRGIVINGPKGPIKVVPDQNCPANRVFGLQLDTWKLYSLGEAVNIIQDDGLTMLRQPNGDGVEFRARGYLNLGCRAPGYNINLQV